MSEAGARPRVSVVIPIFNEEETLETLYRRLHDVLEVIAEPYEVIFVNDGSRDGSERLLREFHRRTPAFKTINFSRNFGHQVAVTCGLDHAVGDAIIAMDGDLQDPPEVLPGLVARWREGYEVVYAVRQARKENVFKRAAYKSFYWILNRVSYLDIPLDSGDFSLIDRRVVEVLRAMPERNRFVRGLRTWAGFRQIGYEYAREARFAGESKYSLGKLLKLAFDGLVSYSYVPLRLVSNVGLLVSASALGYMGYLLLARLLGDVTIRGWTSTVVIQLFLGGVQLLSLGVIGEYVGRIFEEVKQRPHYIVRDRVGFADTDGVGRGAAV
ncbi:MAG: glycosyltransferase family 2 protein [Deltaproteobacteria bacterium]|nr:glycosyltransferase family 2 protein [Deltaproteobacteria bacterium]